MPSTWIIVLVAVGVAGLVALAVFIVRAVRRQRERREAADRARRELAARFGLEVHQRPDNAGGSDPVVRGIFEGTAIEIDEYWRGGPDSSCRLTRWQVVSPTPWPGGLVAYTPGFTKAIGGPHGRVHDSTDPIHGLLASVNDCKIGDPDLDPVLAIDAADLDVVRSLLLAPDVKRWILHATSTFGHIRIQKRETAIEVERQVVSVEELIEGARTVIAVARALEAASSGIPDRKA
jgi:hypothetical protein